MVAEGRMEPQDIVQASMDAYNAHDIDATFASFAPDVVVKDADGKIMMDGLDEVRSRYAKWRADNPDIRYEIVRRIALGEWVVDEERVSGLAEPRADQVLRAIILYRVSNGRVREIQVLN
jgi:hypothetical protein